MDIYRELQRSLDAMPVGFPASESGVEIRILQRLFTPEEARLAVALSALPEPVSAIHKRVGSGLTRDALAKTLGRMAEKGLIEKRPGPEPRYSRSLFVVGIYERQLNRLTPELARDVLQYFEEAFGPTMHSKRTPQLRTIPVDQAIEPERGIGQFDDLRRFVETSEGPFAAVQCICRQTKGLVGEPCKQTGSEPNCLMFGVAARWAIRQGAGPSLTREEMLALVDRADRDGLVLEPQNTRNPWFVCCCCGCCCGVLTTARKLPCPAEYFRTNYYAERVAERCQACGACVARCQMDAIPVDGNAQVDLARCIGCGLCVSTCPSGAMQLRAKEKPAIPPKDVTALYMKIYRERFGVMGMARTLTRTALGLKT